MIKKLKTNTNLIAATIIFIGGLFSVVGAFLAARQAINDGKELDSRNGQIIELTKENAKLSKQALDQITGGKSWAFIRSGLETEKGIMNQESLWTINLVGDIPLYDVSLTLYKIKHDNTLPTKAHNLITVLSKHLGTITPSLHQDNIGLLTLHGDKGKIEFLVKIKARNGEITQHIILLQKEGKYWTKAEKVFRYKPADNGGFSKEVLMQKIDEDFPDKDHIEWIEL
ncbi:MAG: hypothetical protein HOP08_02335 [Cyclobacteriaceae bacterium]|nr:hypothetical protein [Cyclobacteriaceae bacterium]